MIIAEKPPLRTYLIEPQTIFVPFLERVLRDGGLRIVASGEDVDERDISLHEPEVIFVDVDFFERGAPKALCRIRSAFRRAAVVAFSDATDPTFEASCYISGATLFVSKRIGAMALTKTVRELVGSLGAPPGLAFAGTVRSAQRATVAARRS